MTESLPPRGYELLMPFVVTEPQGPLNARAYVVGYETGVIDARLKYERPAKLTAYVHTVGMPQVDLLAMKYGYDLVTEELDETWAWVEFTKKGAPNG